MCSMESKRNNNTIKTNETKQKQKFEQIIQLKSNWFEREIS